MEGLSHHWCGCSPQCDAQSLNWSLVMQAGPAAQHCLHSPQCGGESHMRFLSLEKSLPGCYLTHEVDEGGKGFLDSAATFSLQTSLYVQKIAENIFQWININLSKVLHLLRSFDVTFLLS